MKIYYKSIEIIRRKWYNFIKYICDSAGGAKLLFV